MLDDVGRRALVERLKKQGWDQGCLIRWRADLFLASREEALTPEAEATTSGEGHLGLVFEIKKDGARMVIVSQRCDIVGETEPLVEAIPLQIWPDKKALPGLNSSRYFVIDRDRRLVADSTRRLLFEKTLLADEDAEQLCADNELGAFTAWCARRYSRVAFPDDFVATVGYALEEALKKRGKKDPDAQKALHSWRVRLAQPADDKPIEVSFLAVFDEERAGADSVEQLVADVLADAQAAVPKFRTKAVERAKQLNPSATVREHLIATAVPVAMSQVSLRDLRDYPAFNLEHMTYDGDEALGVEPHEEAVA